MTLDLIEGRGVSQRYVSQQDDLQARAISDGDRLGDDRVVIELLGISFLSTRDDASLSRLPGLILFLPTATRWSRC